MVNAPKYNFSAYFRCLLFFILFSFTTTESFAQENSNPLIDEIRVNGLNKLTKHDFMGLLPFAKGDKFDEKLTAQSISALFTTNYFVDASVSFLTNGLGNKIIVYTVIERPWISDIKIKGNSGVTATTIKEKLSNTGQSFFNPYVLSKDLQTVQQLYLSEGYVGTHAEFSEEYSKDTKKKKNEVTLILTVYEGSKLSVNSIKVNGLKILTPDYMKSDFATLKEPFLFGLINHPLIPEVFTYEEQRMSSLAFNQGFLDFKVTGARIKINVSYKPTLKRLNKELRGLNFKPSLINSYLKSFKDAFLNKDSNRIDTLCTQLESDGYKIIKKKKKKDDFTLFIGTLKTEINSLFNVDAIIKKALPPTIPIEVVLTDKEKSGYDVTFFTQEGKQYIFAGVSVIGSKRVDETFLKTKFLTLFPGDIYDDSLFNSFKQKITQYYRDKGYFGVIVQDTPEVDPKTLTVSHRLLVQEGQKMHIERMYIKGNEKTKNFVIDRELRTSEGAVFNQSKIMLSDRLLQRTGYFKDINVMPSPGSEENLLDLTWKVAEQKTGSFQFGGGYGTETGFSIYGNFSETNFLGLGLTTSAQVEWGEYQKSIQAAVSSNYINYLPVSWRAAIGFSWIRQEASPRYDRNHDGVWDKVIEKNGNYYFVQQGDADFNNYYDENRTGNFNPGSTASGSQVSFTPSDADDLYSDDRYFDRQVFFLELGTGYSFANFWSVHLGNGYMDSKYSNPHNIDVDNLYEDNYYRLKTDLETGDWSYSSFIDIGVTYNSTNSPLSPSRGMKTSLDFSFYGIEGGFDNFTKINFSFAGYVPLVDLVKQDWKLVWATSLNVATIGNFFYSDPHLHYENQLSFNTMEEVRGWADYVNNAELLGLGKVSFSTELRSSIPHTNNILWLLVFFDAGNMSENPWTVPLNFSDYLYSVGFGVRIDMASLPLRFYLAQRLKWEDGWFRPDGGLAFQFAMTSSF